MSTERTSERVMRELLDTAPEFGVFVNGSRVASALKSAEAARAFALTRYAADTFEVHEIDKSQLRPELMPFEGARIEATDADGERVRFIVGRSTGWRPCHLVIKRRDSHGGTPVDERGYTDVRLVERIR